LPEAVGPSMAITGIKVLGFWVIFDDF